jgi:hypothetical protein
LPIIRVADDARYARPDGSVTAIYIEVDEPPPGDGTSIYAEQETRGAAGRAVAVARDVFDEGVELARSCAARVADALGTLPGGVRPPNEFELQLAIKLDAQLGAILTKATAGAQMQVTLRWQLETRDGSSG